MTARGISVNEEARLKALRDLKLLDTPPSESFDRLTRLASQLLSAPVSTISLTDHDRQWFKSRVGVDLTEIPRDKAPCTYAIQDRGLFVVPDLTMDARFCDSPLAQAGIRFYAGAPLFTRAGYGLGTLCVADVMPRQITDDQARGLQDLAAMVMTQIELQTMIGRVEATSGYPNQHQLLDDLDERGRAGGGPVSMLLVEFASAAHARRGLRVLGPSGVENFVRQALERVQARIGNAARLYHVGELRCVVLLAATAPHDLDSLAAALAEDLRPPIASHGVPLAPNPAIGLYTFAAGEVAPRDALRRLVNACEDARTSEGGRASYCVARDAQNARSLRILNDFAAALCAPGQLHLVYQPRIALASGRRVGVEALLRWAHPELGRIPPGEFIPLIEQTALARPLTEWVVGSALAQLGAWRRSGLDLAVAVNASAINLEERDFARRLLRAIDDAGVDARDLELEFTESAIANDTRRVIEQLDELRRHGVAIAIDDFGTGRSNLSCVQQLPVSILKIDRSFTARLPHSSRDRTLVGAVVSMAHDLGYRVVAEGIETREALELLVALGCDEGQGYLFSPPLPAREVRAAPLRAAA